VYWYAVKSFDSENEFSTNNLETYFESYHPIIKELLRLTPQKSIHSTILEDLSPLKKWWQENACLLGDAAHATTPNLGQGACQAIEDAYVLSNCLEMHPTEVAFAEYQRIRLPKAHQIVKSSRRIGKLAHWKNPLAVLLRNGLMKMTPENITRKQSEKIFEIERLN
jgi:2-polyprenyl-6-methoxyphenol hydroxylase-like FAD-dependent oxidoreductase